MKKILKTDIIKGERKFITEETFRKEISDLYLKILSDMRLSNENGLYEYQDDEMYDIESATKMAPLTQTVNRKA